MPQSLAKLYTHLTFSTKHREPCLTDDVRSDLHAHMGGTLHGLGCVPIEINSVLDHIHALFLLGRTIAVSDLIGALKTSSNDWLRGKGSRFAGFHWQTGYGAFPVGQSRVDDLRQYIRNQREHHQRVSFQDEFRAFLRRYEIEYDERYVWDWALRRPFRAQPISGCLTQGIGLAASALGYALTARWADGG